jgi:mono/diheme cytochrome c family protein
LTSANLARAAVLAAAAFGLSGCTDWAGYDLDRASGAVPAFSTMRNDVSPDPYQMVREPVPGTVPAIHPLGDVPAPYTQAQLDSVAVTLVNPLQPTAQVLARGKQVYDSNCSVCHGDAGQGNGPVVNAQTKFPFAPAVNGAATAARSDGYVYGVIDVGRNFMPPYGARITHLDRWAVVTYVRHLQGRAGVSAPAPAATPQISAGAQALEAGTVPAGGEPQPAASQPQTVESRPSSTVP